MMTRVFYKANDAGGESIEISDTLPTIEASTHDEIKQIYDKDARNLAHALVRSLPGGTFDRLLVYLLAMAQSQLSIKHQEPEPIGKVGFQAFMVFMTSQAHIEESLDQWASEEYYGAEGKVREVIDIAGFSVERTGEKNWTVYILAKYQEEP